MPNFLKLEGMDGIEIDLRLDITEFLYLLNITGMYIQMTGDSELIQLYEKLYAELEPYGTAVDTNEVDQDG